MASENSNNITFSEKHIRLLALARDAEDKQNGMDLAGLRTHDLLAQGMFDAPESVFHLVSHGLLENQINPRTNTESNVYAVTPKGQMLLDRHKRILEVKMAAAKAAAQPTPVPQAAKQAPKPAAKPPSKPKPKAKKPGTHEPIPDIA